MASGVSKKAIVNFYIILIVAVMLFGLSLSYLPVRTRGAWDYGINHLVGAIVWVLSWVPPRLLVKFVFVVVLFTMVSTAVIVVVKAVRFGLGLVS